VQYIRQLTITLQVRPLICPLNPKAIKHETTSGCLQTEAIMLDGKPPRVFFRREAVEKLKNSATVRSNTVANAMGGMPDASIS